MTINRAIRASDQDREHVVDILRTEYSKGRLTLAEFDERMGAAYDGKTWGDLLEVAKDLPVKVRLGADQAADTAVKGAAPDTAERLSPPGRPVAPAFPLVPLVPVLLAAVLLSSATWGGHGHPRALPFIPLLVITLLFLRRGMRWRRGGR